MDVSSTRNGSPDDLLGSVLAGRYRLDRFIARGGMGVVFSASDLREGVRVAVKILEQSAEDPLSRRRFFNEAAMCASLDHPNVVRILDYGVAENQTCFIVMELLKGRSLGRMLDRRPGNRLLPLEALYVAEQISASLIPAHAQGFVHRDLKPSNIVVVGMDPQGPRIKVLDFGLAKRLAATGITDGHTFLGSPSFMSPEQIRRDDLGPETDLYNIGLLLFRMVTGHTAFRQQNVTATLAAHLEGEVPRLHDVADDLPTMKETEWMIRILLSKDPSERFRTADELYISLLNLRGYLDGSLDGLDVTLDGENVQPELEEGEEEDEYENARTIRFVETPRKPQGVPGTKPDVVSWRVPALLAAGLALVVLFAGWGIFSA